LSLKQKVILLLKNRIFSLFPTTFAESLPPFNNDPGEHVVPFAILKYLQIEGSYTLTVYQLTILQSVGFQG